MNDQVTIPNISPWLGDCRASDSGAQYSLIAFDKVIDKLNLPERKILLIGLGEAGGTHLEVLEKIPSLSVVAAVDVDASRSASFRNKTVPLYRSSFDVSSKHDPDVVVIATPTPSHAQLCDEIANTFPDATILVEKPAADNLLDAQRLLDGSNRNPVNVALHMAFAPEVRWAANVVHARPFDLGMPLAIQSWAADPYQSNMPAAEAALGTSWIDSGINALSVIELFVKVVERESLRHLGRMSWSTFEGVFRCESGQGELEAVILTS